MICPICKKELKNKNNLPFCSNFCKMKDLLNWLNEKYIIIDKKENNDKYKKYN